MPNATRLKHSAPHLLLVLGLAAFVTGLGAAGASMAPSALRPIAVHAGGAGTARRDWRTLPPRAVAVAHPAPEALTRDLPVPNPQRVVTPDLATAHIST